MTTVLEHFFGYGYAYDIIPRHPQYPGGPSLVVAGIKLLGLHPAKKADPNEADTLLRRIRIEQLVRKQTIKGPPLGGDSREADGGESLQIQRQLMGRSLLRLCFAQPPPSQRGGAACCVLMLIQSV